MRVTVNRRAARRLEMSGPPTGGHPQEAGGILCVSLALLVLAGVWLDRRGWVPQLASSLFRLLGVGAWYLVLSLLLAAGKQFKGQVLIPSTRHLLGWLALFPLLAGLIQAISRVCDDVGHRFAPGGFLFSLLTGFFSMDSDPGGSVGLRVYNLTASLLGPYSATILLVGTTLALVAAFSEVSLVITARSALTFVAASSAIVFQALKVPCLAALKAGWTVLKGFHGLVFILLKDLVTFALRLSDIAAHLREVHNSFTGEVVASASSAGVLAAPGHDIGVPTPSLLPNRNESDDRDLPACLSSDERMVCPVVRPRGFPGLSSQVIVRGARPATASPKWSTRGSSAVDAAAIDPTDAHLDSRHGALPPAVPQAEQSKTPSSPEAKPKSILRELEEAVRPRGKPRLAPAQTAPLEAHHDIEKPRPSEEPEKRSDEAKPSTQDPVDVLVQSLMPETDLRAVMGPVETHEERNPTSERETTDADPAHRIDSPAETRPEPVRETEAPAPSTTSFCPDTTPRQRPQETIVPVEEIRRPTIEPEPRQPRLPVIPPSPEAIFNPTRSADPSQETEDELKGKASRIVETLRQFRIDSEITHITRGSAVTQFELKPAAGVKLQSISALANNLSMSLATKAIRIEAPIPGKPAVGIEVPNDRASIVSFGRLMSSTQFKTAKSLLAFAIGEDITGEPVVGDLTRMPHLLVAGTTGSGKSVCINTILASILSRATPTQVKFILIDPKRVELSIYNDIPHLITQVVTDPQDAAHALKWAVMEMDRRYQYLSRLGFRNIQSYNEAQASGTLEAPDPTVEIPDLPMPFIVVVIDELADLMVVARKQVEESIVRLTQMARAVGIHVVVATQRPSVNVITGIIKANLPSRIAFAVASKVDSKVIIDTVGAEKLLGKGDMLYLPVGEARCLRLQGAFIDDEEVKRLVGYLKQFGPPDYSDIVEEVVEKTAKKADNEFHDDMWEVCLKLAIEKGEVSTSMLQTHLKIGYNRAARIVEEMEARGLISGQETGKRRTVLMSSADLADQI